MQVLVDIGFALLFSLVGALSGTAIVALVAGFIPRVIDRLTPAIDEEKEILRGNRAVAEYFGRISGAAILGVSIVVAVSILAGMFAALHG